MGLDDADARLQVRHEGSDYRRVEVITGRRRRRSWTPAEKARIVAANSEPGANISSVARRLGVNRGLLTIWRRQVGFGRAKAAAATKAAVQFVPVMVADEERQLDHGGARKSDAPAARELIYTALTRQVDGVVLFVQGQPSDLRAYTSSKYSEIARRYTNLFAAPDMLAEPPRRSDRLREDQTAGARRLRSVSLRRGWHDEAHLIVGPALRSDLKDFSPSCFHSASTGGGNESAAPEGGA
ncbi:transposase [Aquibium sp. ELW1220]|uniref:IS66-like element accessory protein TnpA n=1 Tax=Aquibium sp. ELW1220 TaxID=2976766 RepID=UPI0025B0F6D6|nr:transposase [Aquibium sp. ELW1220]MDN2584334.1 transposase [Aquibium sp. ELW1220]